MIKSKAWKWEMIDKNNEFWNTPAPEIYYLSQKWKENGFINFLDVGCGFGRNLFYMAKQGFDCWAFDLSAHAVELTKEKAKEQNINIENICVADMLSFPFKNESFDCLLALNVISHTDKIGFDKILKEIKRVLKPNGEAYFTLGSKESFWFNNSKCIPVDENTVIRVEDGPENGIPHFYIDDKDCINLFNDFKIIEIKNVRQLTQYGNFSPHYHVWLKK